MANKHLKIYVGSDIRFFCGDLEQSVVDSIKSALTIVNEEKIKQLKLKTWIAHKLPDNLEFFTIDTSEFIAPRGFLFQLVDGLEALELDYELVDNRVYEPIESIGSPIEPRAWQTEAIEKILDLEQGIVRQPAGSGKTVVTLAAIQKASCKSLIIVNTKDVMWQWMDRVKTFLGEDYPCGQIGAGKFEVSPYITIATAQTLHSRYTKLMNDGFFDEFSFVCADECHHLSAKTERKVFGSFSARYRIGVSATPDKTGDFTISKLFAGDIIHSTKPSEVTALMTPKVVKVQTPFWFRYKPTVSRRERNNYPELIQSLIRHTERNELIVKLIMENQGHHQLLISKRLEHLDTLEQIVKQAGFKDPISTITGADKNEERVAATELANSSPSLILSTVADEALDIPRLDRLHLTYPQKNTGLITQQVGRVARVHPDKIDAVVYDYTDPKVEILSNQWRKRRIEVYDSRGIKVEVM